MTTNPLPPSDPAHTVPSKPSREPFTAKLNSAASLISAAAAVAGVLLGFFGLPAVGVSSPTAAPQTTITVVKTVVESVPGPTLTVNTAPTVAPVKVTDPSQNDIPLSYLNASTGAFPAMTLGAATLGGTKYDQAFTGGLDHFDLGMSYSVSQRYQRFTFTAGMDDNGWAGCAADLFIVGDGKTLRSIPMIIHDAPKTDSVDISNVNILEIHIHARGYSCYQGGTAVLAAPVLHVT